ncbi:pyocin knob domain-containing S74 family peptidase [Achromobacter aegrifaciens]
MAGTWYRTGTLTLTLGSALVAGAGTAFLTNVRAGDMLIGPIMDMYEVTDVLSDTELRIDKAYVAATYSGTDWSIAPTTANLRQLAHQISSLVTIYQDLPETATTAQAAATTASAAAQAASASASAAKSSETMATSAAATATAAASSAGTSASTAATDAASASTHRGAALASANEAKASASSAATSAANAAVSASALDSLTNVVAGVKATADAARKRQALTAPTDANTLTATNTIYTWIDGSTVTGGSHWPPVASGSVGAGYAEVFYITSGFAVQECVLPINGQKPRRFTRLGFGESWEPWKIIGPLSSTAYLPTADCGDVYVDGRGWYRWNGSTYVGQTLASGQLKLMEGTTLYGSFTGTYAEGISTVLQDNLGETYVTAVPGPGGGYAGFLARGWKNANSPFVLMGIRQDSGIPQLLFSRHGTAGYPYHMTIDSATGECGRVMEDGRWQFGRFVMPNVQAKLHVSYNGGGLEYGMVLRPINALDSTAIQFQSSTGGVAGYIYSTNSLTTVYATTSDYRSKTKLGDLKPLDSLETIKALRPINFRMKGAPDDSAPQRGFIAHELQHYIPNAVVGEKDEMMGGPGGPDAPKVPKYQGVDLSRIVPDLVGAVQAQQQQIEALVAQVDGLSAQVDALVARLNAPATGEDASTTPPDTETPSDS